MKYLFGTKESKHQIESNPFTDRNINKRVEKKENPRDYHPWFLRSCAKNCPTKPIPRMNILFRDSETSVSVEQRRTPVEALGNDSDFRNLGRRRLVGKLLPTWRGVARNWPDSWHMTISPKDRATKRKRYRLRSL